MYDSGGNTSRTVPALYVPCSATYARAVSPTTIPSRPSDSGTMTLRSAADWARPETSSRKNNITRSNTGYAVDIAAAIGDSAPRARIGPSRKYQLNVARAVTVIRLSTSTRPRRAADVPGSGSSRMPAMTSG